MIYLLIAVLSGVSTVIARVLNYVLAEKIGVLQGTFFNYVTGLLGSCVLLLISGDTLKLFTKGAYSAPWWAYLGGLLGIVVIGLSSYLSSKLAAFYVTLLLFVGQLFTGILIDYISLGEFSLYKILGGILVCIGLGYNLILDQKADAKKD